MNNLQRIIDKELPGFSIVPTDLISAIESSPDHPLRRTVITADFNKDKKQDFAAMVVKTNGKTPVSDGQPFGVAVCFGTKAKHYECGLLGKTGSISLPVGFYLEVAKPGKLHCFDSWVVTLGKEQNELGRQEELGEKDLLIKGPSIGRYRTMGNGDIVFIYQSPKRFLTCLLSD